MQTLWLAAFDDPMLEEAPCEVVQETAIEALSRKRRTKTLESKYAICTDRVVSSRAVK